MSARVLFLDLRADGRRGAEPIDPACVERVNRIVEESDAHVVVSSSWRYRFDVAEHRELLGRYGLDPKRVVDRTPLVENESPRGKVIERWLRSQRSYPQAICILDDDDDMKRLRRYLVRTDFKVGLTDDDAAKATRMLTRGGG